MALDATPKGATSNSYATVAEANTFLTERRLYSTEWDAAVTATRERALIWATALLDASMEWTGAPRTLEQALRWPRSGVLNLDGENVDEDTIPQVLVEAVAELALFLLKQDRSEQGLLGQGFSAASIGPISVTVDSTQALELIPHAIKVKLLPLGTMLSGAVQGPRTVKLERT